ncbi:PRC and DUF2382 domain-containing protein [Actinomyces radicidentis]|uniref:PRC and DUF2382 domain-containing protein n=1 Tax=Actinomyces radicidentis TaxID=111015 RepID=UPI0028E89420|nr:PRC and DUF2382 domain-containing protein [Actinomyces radicidentis]
MTTNERFDTILSATVLDQDGDKIGKVGQLFLDDQTGEPTWVTVSTGLFGTKETFVPLQGASIAGDEIRVPYEKGFVKDAPNLDVDEHLSTVQEDELFRYYNLGGTTTGYAGTERTAGTDRAAAGHVDEGRTAEYADRDRAARTDRSQVADATADGSVVAHEERLNVGTEQRETGKVRLRKYVVTETQSVEVPVQREELRVEREPINERVTGDDVIGEDVSDGETITLHEEVPVVSKETVATERVSVGKETVQDTETVQAEVAKEQVEVEGDESLRNGQHR